MRLPPCMGLLFQEQVITDGRDSLWVGEQCMMCLYFSVAGAFLLHKYTKRVIFKNSRFCRLGWMDKVAPAETQRPSTANTGGESQHFNWKKFDCSINCGLQPLTPCCSVHGSLLYCKNALSVKFTDQTAQREKETLRKGSVQAHNCCF